MAPRRFSEPIYAPPRPRGRPKKRVEHGHEAGTSVQKQRVSNGNETSTSGIEPSAPPPFPRLIDLHEAAQYLCLSPWAVKDLVSAGTLSRIRIPLQGDKELRELLFDKRDLDLLIEKGKGA